MVEITVTSCSHMKWLFLSYHHCCHGNGAVTNSHIHALPDLSCQFCCQSTPTRSAVKIKIENGFKKKNKVSQSNLEEESPMIKPELWKMVEIFEDL